MDEKSEARAIEMSQRIVASNPFSSLRGVDRSPDFWPWPQWYSDVVMKLDVINVADPILYLTSSLATDRVAGGEVFALTDGLALHVEVDDVKNDHGQVKLTVWSRAELKELKILQADNPGAFDVAKGGDVPMLSLELQYAERDEIRLPFGSSVRSERTLGKIYPDLLRDLGRG